MQWQNFNWKKLIAPIIFILVAIGFGLALYYLFFKPTFETPPTEEPQGIEQLPDATTGTQPGLTEGEETTGIPELPTKSITKITAPEKALLPSEIAQGGLTATTALSFEKADKISLDSTGKNPLIYNAQSGEFYSIDENGDKKLLTEKIYKNIETIALSSDKTKAILEFPDDTNIYFNFEKNKQITLPKEWTEFSFNSTADKIAFKNMDNDPEQRFLGIANPDGSGIKYIESMSTNDDHVEVNWSPNEKVLAFYKDGDTSTTSKLYLLGQYGENFKSITINGYGANTQWSTNGEKLLYSAYTPYTDNKPLLQIVDTDGENIGANNNSLKVYTWADKCVFADATTVYCAVPKEMPSGAGLVPRLADSVPDYIYKIDLKKGTKSFVAEPDGDYTIDQLQVNSDQSRLFFTDKNSGAIYQIKLK